MTDVLLPVLVFLTALGCGVVAGAFFAFSSFVMEALSRLPAPRGIAAMQSINVVVINLSFMGALFGTGLACLSLAVRAVLTWGEPAAARLLAGSLVYLFGTVFVTIAFNVPRNESLADLSPESTEGARIWDDYVVTWTRWNHVRTIAALLAAALFIWALQA